MFHKWLFVSIAIVHFTWCDSSTIKSRENTEVTSNKNDDKNKIQMTTLQFPAVEDHVDPSDEDYYYNENKIFYELNSSRSNDSYSWYQYSAEIKNQNLSEQHYSSRAAMWRTKYWSLQGNNVRLIKNYRSLKTEYSTLSSKFYWFVEDWNCADFFRDYIPHVEKSFLAIESQQNYEKTFNDDFEKENPTFADKFLSLKDSNNRIYKVYNALKEIGVKITNRSACSFEFMTDEEYEGPPPKEIKNCPGSEKSNLNLCEKWAFFLYAVKSSPKSRNPELQMWLSIIRSFEEYKKQPYPLLVQRIFYTKYHSNQFHYAQKHNYLFGATTKLHDDNETLDRNQQVYCLYKMLLGWQQNQNTLWFSTTETCTPPAVYQEKLNGRAPTTSKATENLDGMAFYRKCFGITLDTTTTTTPTT